MQIGLCAHISPAVPKLQGILIWWSVCRGGIYQEEQHYSMNGDIKASNCFPSDLNCDGTETSQN
jgi:hypothetical protein